MQQPDQAICAHACIERDSLGDRSTYPFLGLTHKTVFYTKIVSSVLYKDNIK